MSPYDVENLNVKDISFINNIKTMAVIGVSKKNDYFFLRSHSATFKGNVYAIHPSLKEIPNFDSKKIYPSLKDVPEPIDFVFIAVPAAQALEVMDECVQKGVKLASVFTASFSDAGTKEGEELEKELLRKAQNKVRIIGPNGMGLYYPKVGIQWRPKFPTTVGKIALLAQSGGLCNISIYMATELGLSFSKVFSFGNGADLDFVDLIYYLSNDPETDIILCYVEGIKKARGKDLMQVLELNKKPIIVLKGGQTKFGAVAAKTHTASVAGENKIWRSIFKKYNVLEVDSLEQMLYAATLVKNYGLFDAKKLAIFSVSGGYGVILTDLICSHGLELPQFSEDVQKQISAKFFAVGTSSKNPLDVSTQLFNSKIMSEVIDLALADKNIDGLIMDLPPYYFNPDFQLKKNLAFEDEMVTAFSLGHKHKKPLILIIQHLNFPEERGRVVKKLVEKNVPVFGEPLNFITLLPKIGKITNGFKESK